MRLAAAERADEITLGATTLPVANAVMFTVGAAVLITADGLQMPAKVLAKTITASPAGTITLNRGVVASLRRSSVRVYEGISAGQISDTVRAGATELDRNAIKNKKDFPHDPNPGDLLLLVDASGVELAIAAGTLGSTIYLAQPLTRALRPVGHAFDPFPTVRIFIVAPNDPAAHVTKSTPVILGDLPGTGGCTVLDLDRTYEELTAGAVIAASDGAKLRAATVMANDSVEGKTRLTLDQALDADMQVARLVIYGPFELASRIDGYDRSEATLAAGATQLELAAAQTGLAPGAHLLVAGGGQVEGARVTAVSATGAKTVVSLARALENGYVLGDTVVYGNVVPVTHGATAPDEVLGSGDPSQPSQRFLLRRSPLAFVPDPTAERGVRAAVEVFVDGERWTEVATLADSSGSDKHYLLDIDENERAFVQFGDGTFGAQPASGRNNVIARYRVGHGLAANVPANTIAQMPQPLPFLQATFNGLAAGGGEERETPEQTRRSAAHRVRTLGRAVSLGDYADLALTFGGVAKARADWDWESGRRIILLTLADSGGGALSGELKEALYAFFAERSAAGGRLRIRDHRSVPIRLALQVTVQRNFTQAEVLRGLWQALGADESEGGRGYFHFDSRDLGEDLFLSAIYRIVEEARGVENALATAFHVEGESTQVADRISIPVDALATGGDAADPARGRLSLQLSGGVT
jgi:predicted phage baseplate assembly protein